jgi:uncharacterized protein (TIGR03083 family)
VEHAGWKDAVEALDAQYGLVRDVLSTVEDAEMLAPSACLGWTNTDLVYHMLLDAQRALVTFNSPAPGPADTDYVRYWRKYSASDADSTSHARFVRLSAAAHSEPGGVVHRWLETASAAVRAARKSAATQFLTTQGHVLTTGDFIGTLVVEATVHQLDLLRGRPGRPDPASPAMSLTTRTLDGLLGAPRPTTWDDITYVLKATGRAMLDEEDRHTLGEDAGRFPLFS